MKTYVLVWHGWIGDDRLKRQTILDEIDKMPSVRNWRASTGAIFIHSDRDESILSEELRSRMPRLEFIISAIDLDTSEGRTDRKTWDFIGRIKTG
jgi:hypothetical protein